MDTNPQSSWQKPQNHPVTSQKIRVWHLEVKEPVLVLGDYLSRITQHNYTWVQIDSFPGAQIHHLKGVIGKLDTCTTTQRIVLLVGLNCLNCLRGNLIETIKKQFQQLVARLVCHGRYLPVHKCSYLGSSFQPGSHPRAQSLIDQTNLFLLQHYRTLHILEEHFFSVQSHEPIHWMSQTALNILDSWMKPLT